MAYSRDEYETTCNYDYLTKTWDVYTSVPTHITKLSKMSEPYWKEEEPDVHGNPRMIAGKWRLSKSQVRFAKLMAVKADDDDEAEEESA